MHCGTHSTYLALLEGLTIDAQKSDILFSSPGHPAGFKKKIENQRKFASPARAQFVFNGFISPRIENPGYSLGQVFRASSRYFLKLIRGHKASRNNAVWRGGVIDPSIKNHNLKSITTTVVVPFVPTKTELFFFCSCRTPWFQILGVLIF